MNFDFEESGTGPALMFLPGSYSNAAGWRAVQTALTGSYRVITTSLLGYGGTAERRADLTDDGLVAATADFVAQIVAHAGEPVHLIGHSYGGLTALAATLSQKVKPLSLITFEANPHYLQRPANGLSWHIDMVSMVGRFKAAHKAGDPAAAGFIIDFYTHSGQFAAMPQRFQDYCREVAHSNVLDWQTAAQFSAKISDFATLDMPCTFVRGELANLAIKDVTESLTDNVPDGRLKIIPASGHFLISTHPTECAAIIDDHMGQYLGR